MSPDLGTAFPLALDSEVVFDDQADVEATSAVYMPDHKWPETSGTHRSWLERLFVALIYFAYSLFFSSADLPPVGNHNPRVYLNRATACAIDAFVRLRCRTSANSREEIFLLFQLKHAEPGRAGLTNLTPTIMKKAYDQAAALMATNRFDKWLLIFVTVREIPLTVPHGFTEASGEKKFGSIGEFLKQMDMGRAGVVPFANLDTFLGSMFSVVDFARMDDVSLGFLVFCVLLIFFAENSCGWRSIKLECCCERCFGIERQFRGMLTA